MPVFSVFTSQHYGSKAMHTRKSANPIILQTGASHLL